VIAVQKDQDYTSECVFPHVQPDIILLKVLAMKSVTNVTLLVLPVTEVLGTTVTLVFPEDSGSNIPVLKSVHTELSPTLKPKNVNTVTKTVTLVTDQNTMIVMIVLLQDSITNTCVKSHVQMVLSESKNQKDNVLTVTEPVKLVPEVNMMIV
jgi:hypothetical protein